MPLTKADPPVIVRPPHWGEPLAGARWTCLLGPSGIRSRGAHARSSIASGSARADDPPAVCSAGMRQSAALVRTLLEDRPVVLMDEPFSALDAITRVQLLRPTTS